VLQRVQHAAQTFRPPVVTADDHESVATRLHRHDDGLLNGGFSVNGQHSQLRTESSSILGVQNQESDVLESELFEDAQRRFSKAQSAAERNAEPRARRRLDM
jgi:hypothetical protein